MRASDPEKRVPKSALLNRQDGKGSQRQEEWDCGRGKADFGIKSSRTSPTDLSKEMLFNQSKKPKG
ncbi:MAG: hypothetical protein LUC39_03705 [Clostridiales bacterium]|nr:hypothetical protein [Clostridiales bacterium]